MRMLPGSVSRLRLSAFSNDCSRAASATRPLLRLQIVGDGDPRASRPLRRRNAPPRNDAAMTRLPIHIQRYAIHRVFVLVLGNMKV
eukprot:6177282-Pleurochrysis_carterae.AAC.2